MTAPTRIQLRRAKGWRLPDGAVSVARPTPWGNPFVVGRDGTQADCVALHLQLLASYICLSAKAEIEDQKRHLRYVEANLPALRGKTLACWCRPGTPCHADTLLVLANR